MSFVKTLDWKGKAKAASKMSMDQLAYALRDCLECVKGGVDEGYYSDEASVYRAEIFKRSKQGLGR